MSDGVTLTQADLNQIILPMMDRLVDPLIKRMDAIDLKLDRAIQVGERVHTVESDIAALTVRVTATEARGNLNVVNITRLESAASLTNRLMTWIGAPVMVVLIVAGIASLFGIGLT